MNNENGSIQQRIGKLIEEHVCKEYNLSPNKRQQTRGYYDAYNKEHIFEIKATSKRNNRITIQLDNHYALLNSIGKYIFVNYNVIDKDKNLSIITDINILHTMEMDGFEVDELLYKHGIYYERNFKGRIKEYKRLKFDYILEVNND